MHTETINNKQRTRQEDMHYLVQQTDSRTYDVR